MAVYRDLCLNLPVGISFFLQVGVETEGSGPVLDSDVGSGAGDFVGNEDLLRVSIRSAGGWCWGPGRERCGVRQLMKVDGPLETVSWHLWGSSHISPLFSHVWHFHLILFKGEPRFALRSLSSPPSSFLWKLLPSLHSKFVH